MARTKRAAIAAKREKKAAIEARTEKRNAGRQRIQAQDVTNGYHRKIVMLANKYGLSTGAEALIIGECARDATWEILFKEEHLYGHSTVTTRDVQQVFEGKHYKIENVAEPDLHDLNKFKKHLLPQ